ncbi:hypothetical protein [Actinomycetospora straminea]|uniref:Uncharacterized protein n=1 Tax=Actinomycetospora straminea TaxID=663607 RepID=A0ABP9E932_9PSEU|nr:hypothetical protein [Actinomycetospora straminea]MDD7936779.1 hypothetical protein [Actinomycetospora straminea]
MSDEQQDEQHDAASGPRPADRPDPADPAVAAALARTRADLAAHGARTPAMPAGLVDDVRRALAAEETAPRTGHPPTRGRRRALVGGLLAGVVAVVVAVVVVVVATGSPATPAPAPAPPPTAAPAPAGVPTLSSGDGVSALRAGLGRADYGPLADEGRLGDCLAAHGLPPGTRPVGARQVVVDGRSGVLLVLPTGVAARFRLLVVEPGCTTGAPLTVSDTLVGR